MINDLLNYDLKIYQNPDYFKFSIDSVLLAEFVDITYRVKNIIDFCSGNAPIPMILSTKFDKNIVGIEIQKDIYELGLKSINENKINNINFINMDLKNCSDFFDYKFDIITCNPPYFKYINKNVINENNTKAIARHEILINLEDIISTASKIIKHSGSLYFVHRCDRMIEIFDLLKKYNFGLRKIQFVYDNINSSSCFLLVEAKYGCKNDLKVLKPLFIDKYLEEI